MSRVVAHVDLDCFYVAVERGLDPSLRGVPCAVVQYNPFGDLSSRPFSDDRRLNASNGSIIALSYEAKAQGVKRTMRGDDARKICPEIQLVQVPTAHGKADLTVYRKAGAEVLRILNVDGIVCERASIDEVYLDLTAKAKETLKTRSFDEIVRQARSTKVAGQEQEAVQHAGRSGGAATITVDEETGQRLVDESLSWWERPEQEWTDADKLLVCGAAVIASLREQVTEQLGYSCSAGIAVNKMLAKLGSGMHKPNQQTLVPISIVPSLMQTLPLTRVKMMGGKLGERIQNELGVVVVADLLQFTEKQLRERFGDATAMWLHNIARGVEEEPVRVRALPKSHSCSKTFTGRNMIITIQQAQKWLDELASELFERMEADRDENGRIPTLLTIHATVMPTTNRSASWQEGAGLSRNCPLRPSLEHMCQDLGGMLQKMVKDRKQWGIMSLGAGVSNFVSLDKNTPSILQFVRAGESDSLGRAQPSVSPVKKPAGEPRQTCEHNDDQPSDTATSNTPHAAGTEEQQQPEHDPLLLAAAQGFDPAVFAELPPEIQRELLAHGRGAYEASTTPHEAPRPAGKRKAPPSNMGIARFLVPQSASSSPSSKREKHG